VKFTLRMLNQTAQLGVLTGVQDTFKDVLEQHLAARQPLADIWSRYGVVDPTFYGSGHHWMSYPQRFADPFVVLGYMAARWPEAHLNSNFIQLPLFSALDIAEKVSSIVGLTERGLTLVVGLGWRPEEFVAAGTDVKYRVSRFEESVAICRALWAGEEIDHHGKHWSVKGRLGSPPRDPSDVTLVTGAQSVAAARRAARLTDGIHVSWVMNHEGNRKINAAYRDELSAQGRPDPRYWAMAKFISVDEEESRAHARLGRMSTMFSWYSGASTWTSADIKTDIKTQEEAAERTVTGTPSQVVEQLVKHAQEFSYTDAILTWLAPSDDPEENREHFEMLCRDVVVPLAAELSIEPGQAELRV
jgi:alkanesulfonate monooxygenase SsuD/methylene tetrahydromethanopterin reductase-like flavin-dependent oxidoreductase (luciferase family)